MTRIYILIVSLVVTCLILGALGTQDWRKTKINASKQRPGDPALGLDYLVNGAFISSGFPISSDSNVFGSEFGGEEISAFTRISVDDVDMIAPNCFQCHADSLNGKFVLGLGNTSFDFTVDMSFAAQLMSVRLVSVYGEHSKELRAAQPFIRALAATASHIQTEVVGANPADKLAAVLAAHRNQDDLTWLKEPSIEIPDLVVPADPPAWWLLKKKNAMFTTGVGRGDFARLMMASSLLTLQDTTQAREVDHHFTDVLAYINTLEPPKYNGDVDNNLASVGMDLFDQKCSGCHGSYGDEGKYPNYLIDLDLIETDSLLSVSNFAYSAFTDWYNGSWFAKGPNAAHLVPGRGYVAPPLDGVWATAPYFHNGSVPTLYHVLKSSERPVYWKKYESSFAYDHVHVGRQIMEKTYKQDKYTYDTTLPGYGNQGHNFGDKFTEQERMAVLEYLKLL